MPTITDNHPASSQQTKFASEGAIVGERNIKANELKTAEPCGDHLRPPVSVRPALLQLLALILLISAFAAAQTPTKPPATDFRVTLLGTGAPPPTMDRFGPSILVEAGGELFLFDAGRGCLQRLQQLGHEYRDVRAVFLTHLHSDHIVGLPDLWLTGWIVSRAERPLTLFGPVGTADMARHLEEAFAYDRSIRVSDRLTNPAAPHTNPAGGTIHTTEIKEGVVFTEDGVTITAFLVDHRPVTPAFGYRINYGGHSVVLSGDTRFSESLLKQATGVDLLVHEVAYRTGQTQANSPVLAHHTMPDQAGELFARAKPKLAVYSHIVVSRDISDDRLMQITRQTYNGPLVVGADLMSFDIGDRVQVDAPTAALRSKTTQH